MPNTHPEQESLKDKIKDLILQTHNAQADYYPSMATGDIMQLIETHTAQAVYEAKERMTTKLNKEVANAVREAEKRVIDDLIVAQGNYPPDRSYVTNGDSFFCVPTIEVENYQAQLTQERSKDA